MNCQSLLAGFQPAARIQILIDLLAALVAVLSGVAIAFNRLAVLIVDPATNGDVRSFNAFAFDEFHRMSSSEGSTAAVISTLVSLRFIDNPPS